MGPAWGPSGPHIFPGVMQQFCHHTCMRGWSGQELISSSPATTVIWLMLFVVSS